MFSLQKSHAEKYAKHNTHAPVRGPVHAPKNSMSRTDKIPMSGEPVTEDTKLALIGPKRAEHTDEPCGHCELHSHLAEAEALFRNIEETRQTPEGAISEGLGGAIPVAREALRKAMGSAQRVAATDPTTSEPANRLVTILRALDAKAASRPVACLPLRKKRVTPPCSRCKNCMQKNTQNLIPLPGVGGLRKNSKEWNPRKSNEWNPPLRGLQSPTHWTKRVEKRK